MGQCWKKGCLPDPSLQPQRHRTAVATSHTPFPVLQKSPAPLACMLLPTHSRVDKTLLVPLGLLHSVLTAGEPGSWQVIILPEP